MHSRLSIVCLLYMVKVNSKCEGNHSVNLNNYLLCEIRTKTNWELPRNGVTICFLLGNVSALKRELRIEYD